MFSHKLLFVCLVLGLILNGAPNATRSGHNLPAGQDEAIIVTGSESKDKKPSSQDKNQLFPPPEPKGEEKFLLIEPDGKTPADYQRLLEPEQLEFRPKH